MSYSKVTKKGQVTIPVEYRRKYNLAEGVAVTFEETDRGLIVRPVPDIADSAGILSKYENPADLLADLMKTRKENFR